MAGEIKVIRKGPETRFKPIRVSRTEEVKRPIAFFEDIHAKRRTLNDSAAKRFDLREHPAGDQRLHHADHRDRDTGRPASRRNCGWWSTAEVDRLEALAAAGTPIEEICEALGRSKSAVQKTALRNGIKVRSRASWTDEEEATLIRMFQQGAKTAEVAAAVGRDEVSVRGKKRHLRQKGYL